jgi:hypothetical protein
VPRIALFTSLVAFRINRNHTRRFTRLVGKNDITSFGPFVLPHDAQVVEKIFEFHQFEFIVLLFMAFLSCGIYSLYRFLPEGLRLVVLSAVPNTKPSLFLCALSARDRLMTAARVPYPFKFGRIFSIRDLQLPPTLEFSCFPKRQSRIITRGPAPKPHDGPLTHT